MGVVPDTVAYEVWGVPKVHWPARGFWGQGRALACTGRS